MTRGNGDRGPLSSLQLFEVERGEALLARLICERVRLLAERVERHLAGRFVDGQQTRASTSPCLWGLELVGRLAG